MSTLLKVLGGCPLKQPHPTQQGIISPSGGFGSRPSGHKRKEKVMKQYLIATSFTMNNIPLEYEYTVEKRDMRTAHSRNREKYVWNATLEKLFKLAATLDVKIKIGKSGEIRLIMTCGSMAHSFLKAIKENGWKGGEIK